VIIPEFLNTFYHLLRKTHTHGATEDVDTECTRKIHKEAEKFSLEKEKLTSVADAMRDGKNLALTDKPFWK
jgi:hypothetical protein